MSTYLSGNTGEVQVGFNFSDANLRDNNKGIGGEKDHQKKIDSRVLSWEANVTKEVPECTITGGVVQDGNETMTFFGTNNALTTLPVSTTPPNALFKTHVYIFQNSENYRLFMQRRELIDKNGIEHDLETVYKDTNNRTNNCYNYTDQNNSSGRNAAGNTNRAWLKGVGTSVLFTTRETTTSAGVKKTTAKFVPLTASKDKCDSAFRDEVYAVDPVSLSKMISLYNAEQTANGKDTIPNVDNVLDLIAADSGIPLIKKRLYTIDHSQNNKQYQGTVHAAEGSCELLFSKDDLPISKDEGLNEVNLLDPTELGTSGSGATKKQFSQSRLFAGMPILGKDVANKINDIEGEGRVIQFKLLFKSHAEDEKKRGLAFNGYVTSSEIQDVTSDIVKVKVNFISSSDVTFYNAD